MIFSKEKVKLQKISASLAAIQLFNQVSLLVLNDGFVEYAKIIRVLFKMKPNVFANLYNYDLAEIRSHKRAVKEDFADETQQRNFILYKDAVMHAIESANEYITDYTEF
ncbi:hypothetical protein [Pedobacter hartonius]|uniref:HEPN domain-containing protein n=1 Tax=Pedobacter hartonius TaxID=425514 RepID=A0A1H4HB53_9SPHI|nr:hypothetical protein [Pedobacter hartonius]SEB18342.1 hypothetical protein SAMN05443550_11494 [Pedobacter hartonius]